jgi:hypothetical protein
VKRGGRFFLERKLRFRHITTRGHSHRQPPAADNELYELIIPAYTLSTYSLSLPLPFFLTRTGTTSQREILASL